MSAAVGPQSTQEAGGLPSVFVYDGYPGGAGFAEQGFRQANTWLGATVAAIEACECPSGCPSCVQSPKCGNGNEPLDKAGAVQVLRLVQGALAHHERSDTRMTNRPLEGRLPSGYVVAIFIKARSSLLKTRTPIWGNAKHQRGERLDNAIRSQSHRVQQQNTRRPEACASQRPWCRGDPQVNHSEQHRRILTGRQQIDPSRRGVKYSSYDRTTGCWWRR